MKSQKSAIFSLVLLIAVIFPQQAIAFSDVTSVHDSDAINYLSEMGIMNGYKDGTFKPSTPLNRAELVKVLVKSKVGEVSATGRDCFTDVADDWYAKYACYAKNRGWVEGYSDGSFGPSKTVNRAETIAMMLKIYDEQVDTVDLQKFSTVIYSDVSKEAWYASYLYRASLSGIIQSGTYFYPANQMARVDLASALYKLILKLKARVPLTTSASNAVTGTTSSAPSRSSDTSANTSSTTSTTTDTISTTGTTTDTISTTGTTTDTISTSSPFVGEKLYVDPSSNAYKLIGSSSISTTDSKDLEKIAYQPVAKWFGDWNSDIESSVSKYVKTVIDAGALPIMVIYNIPGRDCGSYSAGGSSDAENYKNWVQNFADGISNNKAVVIVEPDALPLDCMYENSMSLIASAVDILKSKPSIYVYIDAGHPNWTSSSKMAERLIQANVAKADGFALNVSNFYKTDETISFGKEISVKIEDKHFIIDTSRNGNGWTGEWCNPSGVKLGQNPTVSTGVDLVDAYLWVKPPGESDGTCNGGPSAGSWWLEYALGLVRN